MTSATLVALRDRPTDPAIRPRRRRGLPVGWPLFALYYGFPVWWVLGAGQLIWPFLTIPMVFWLARRDVKVRWPRGFGIWLGFIFWMLASVVVLHGSHRLLPFAYRAALYIGATITFLYVYNMPEGVLSRSRILRMLAYFFVVIVAGGFLGLALPHVSFTSPLELVLPHHLTANPYVHLMVHPAFAQIQSILGFAVAQPRPSAPFVYTNEWGDNLGLALPLALAASSLIPRRAVRNGLRLVIVLSIVPILLSLNRGLWVALGVLAVYVSVRLLRRGRITAVVGFVMILATAGAIIAASPLGALLWTRVTTPSQSNISRIRVYDTVLQSVQTSPLFGFATPLVPSAATAALGSGSSQGTPAIGTQGQLWLVLYSHGYVGAALFVGWFLFVWVRTIRTRWPVGFWCNATILMVLVTLPVYGLLPAQLFTAMIAAAIGLSDRAAPRRRRPEWDTSERHNDPIVST